jgi:MoaA/NifB/PqqE/SkfB family radical SAM enzyme
MKDNGSTCALAWSSIGMNPSGRVRACGRSTPDSNNPSLKHMTIEQAWNSDYYKKLRLDMLAGIKNNNCTKCHMEEELGGISKRNTYNKTLFPYVSTTTNEDGSIDQKPSKIDIRVGNICNLKCIHCWTGNSSKWYQDTFLLGKYENTPNLTIDNDWISDKGSVWNYVRENADSLKKLNILGGEPFASKEHNLLIDWLTANNKLELELTYVTNATLITPAIVDKLKKFKNVQLGISLDATHNISDFVRFPSKWNELEKIISYIDSVNTGTNFNAYFNYTFYNINVFHLAETYSYCNSKFNNIEFCMGDFVESPKHMSLQNLPRPFKEKIVEKIKNIPNVDFYINYMMNKSLWESHGQVLHNYLNDLDIARKTDWKNIFPEIKNLYE